MRQYRWLCGYIFGARLWQSVSLGYILVFEWVYPWVGCSIEYLEENSWDSLLVLLLLCFWRLSVMCPI
jgi:hypothetical protein